MNLAYPVGTFQEMESVTPEQIEVYINEIEHFPAQINSKVEALNASQLDWPYRPDGWSIKQVVNHCADSHMNSIIRFKLALTEDKPTIRPYLEAKWAELEDGSNSDLKPSIQLLTGLHKKWVILLRSLSEKDLSRSYLHPENGEEWSLKRTIALYAWHCRHHLAHIDQAIASKGAYLVSK